MPKQSRPTVSGQRPHSWRWGETAPRPRHRGLFIRASPGRHTDDLPDWDVKKPVFDSFLFVRRSPPPAALPLHLIGLSMPYPASDRRSGAIALQNLPPAATMRRISRRARAQPCQVQVRRSEWDFTALCLPTVDVTTDKKKKKLYKFFHFPPASSAIWISSGSGGRRRPSQHLPVLTVFIETIERRRKAQRGSVIKVSDLLFVGEAADRGFSSSCSYFPAVARRSAPAC